MTEATGEPSVVVVGDVVASRRFVVEDALLRGLAGALGLVATRVAALEPLHLTSGDRFQGRFVDLGDALAATLRLRLASDDLVLATDAEVDEPVEVRIGVGLGRTSTDGPVGGSAWRHAEDARREAETLPARRTWPPALRSRCRADDPQVAALVNAHLLLQDQLLARLDVRDRRALLGLLDGERQVDVAAELGITQPAIARRLRDRGALALHRALLELSGATAAPGPSATRDR